MSDSAGVLFVLAANAAFWFLLERKTKWRLFHFVPPLLFIYIMPAVFSNTGLIPTKHAVYDWMGDHLLPFFLVLLLLDVDVKATVKVMGRGVFVMLIGSVGVVIGAPIGYIVVKGWLGPEAWKGFGALAGSWVGGTANMAAVAESLGTSGTDFGLAVIADNLVFLVWLPILLQSKNLAGWFHRFTGADQDRLDRMKTAAGEIARDKGRLQMRHLLYLTAVGFGVAWVSTELAAQIHPLILRLLAESPSSLGAFSETTCKILVVTTLAILVSFTPARRIPGSHELAMALVYLFVARMGAKAAIEGLAGQAVPFLVGAYIWIFVHGAFIVLAAKLLKIDVHTAAISSAAAIGGVASAPIVAAYHDERLVPVAVLMALIGYAMGNYAGFLAAWLCHLVA